MVLTDFGVLSLLLNSLASSTSAVIALMISRKLDSWSCDKSLDSVSILLISCLVGRRIVSKSRCSVRIRHSFIQYLPLNLQIACQLFLTLNSAY